MCTLQTPSTALLMLPKEPVLSEQAGQHSVSCQLLSALLTQISAIYIFSTFILLRMESCLEKIPGQSLVLC